MAMGANDPIWFSLTAAAGAKSLFLDLREQRLFFECAQVDFFHRLGWTKNEIDHKTGEIEDCGAKDRKDLHEAVLAALAYVSQRPEYEAQP